MARKEPKETYKYNNERNKAVYDRISLMVPKGKKDLIRAAAEEKGESANAFINRAIDALLDREYYF